MYYNITFNVKCTHGIIVVPVVPEPETRLSPPPPGGGGNFADQLCLKVHCIRNVLSHVSTLAVGAFGCNGDLKTVTMTIFAIIPPNI